MEIRELKLSKRRDDTEEAHLAPLLLLLQEIVKLERHLFPKHESLSNSLEMEARKKNTGILYAMVDDQKKKQKRRKEEGEGMEEEEEEEEGDPLLFSVAGYVIFSFTSSMAASIIKLAG